MGGGGLAYLVRDSLQYKVRDDLEVWIEGEFESFSVEVEFEEKNYLFCIIYRPPSTVFDCFIAGFDDLMLNVRNSGLKFLIMDDFNYDLKIIAGMNLDFFNFMSSHDLYPVVAVSTRITEHYATLIDNILISSRQVATICADVIILPISDHLPALAKLELRTKSKY